MLAISITGTVFAQNAQSKSDKTFELPVNYAKRRFVFDLGQGNKMQIELAAVQDLANFRNIDSLVQILLKDLGPLKDSLGDGINARRIDYRLDTTDSKKIRIQNFHSKGSTFIINNGDLSSLKIEQDTINFIGSVYFQAKYTLRRPFPASRFYRLSFFLNDLNDLQSLADGRLGKKIQSLENNLHTTWVTTTERGKAILEADPTITSARPKGMIGGGDFINLRISADLQNYKSYFVPSVSLGVGLIFSTSHFKRDIVLSWDPNFFFAKDSASKLRAFRNDFVTLTWGQGLVTDYNPRKESHLLFIMSLAYLVNRNGEYMDRNTFRLGAGRLSLFSGKTKIEPAIYFNNFFKGVTPAVRLIQSF